MKTLDDVRAFIAHEAARLDPGSRYPRELAATVDASSNVRDLVRRLLAGCRGKYWAGAAAFAAMSLPDKLRANLITCETSLMRHDAPELEFLRSAVLPSLSRSQGEARLLSLPCAHGQEAAGIAGECLDAGIRTFTVHGIDAQRACIDVAGSGTFPYPGLPHAYCTIDPDVMRHLRFRTADVFAAQPLGGPYDIVVCRNFLGFFRPAVARKALQAICATLRSDNAFLLVDDFIVHRHPKVFDGLPLQRIDGMPAFCSLTSNAAANGSP